MYWVHYKQTWWTWDLRWWELKESMSPGIEVLYYIYVQFFERWKESQEKLEMKHPDPWISHSGEGVDGKNRVELWKLLIPPGRMRNFLFSNIECLSRDSFFTGPAPDFRKKTHEFGMPQDSKLRQDRSCKVKDSGVPDIRRREVTLQP